MRYNGSLQSNRKRSSDFFTKKNQKNILIAAGAALLIIILLLALCSSPSYKQSPDIVIESVSASSQESSKFKAEFAVDGNPETGWSPARSQSGSGQFSWIRINLKEATEVSGIRLINGVVENQNNLYDKYNRLKSARVALSDHASYFWVLKDNHTAFQTLSFPNSRTTSSIQIYVHSIYRGTHWDQLCISEIIVY